MLLKFTKFSKFEKNVFHANFNAKNSCVRQLVKHLRAVINFAKKLRAIVGDAFIDFAIT